MKPLRQIVESKHYHSVFYLNKDKWCHHTDCDDAHDAREEAESLRNSGEKVKTFRVPKAQANWYKVDPHQYVLDRLHGAKHK